MYIYDLLQGFIIYLKGKLIIVIYVGKNGSVQYYL